MTGTVIKPASISIFDRLNLAGRTAISPVRWLGRSVRNVAIGNSHSQSLRILDTRMASESQSSSKVSNIFKKVASIAGWGTWLSQIALSGPMGFTAVVDSKSDAYKKSSYGLIGFPLSSVIGLKMSFDRLITASKIKDKEGLDYRIAEVAMNIFAVIGGTLFVLARFAVEAGLAFGISVAVLPMYAVSYFIDMGKNSHMARMSRKFGKEMNEIVKNENDLNDPGKLKQALELLTEQIKVKDHEKNTITSNVLLNRAYESNEELKDTEIKKRVSDLALTKYRKLERRIGAEAAEHFRTNLENAFDDLRSPFPRIDAAKELVEKVQKGISSEIKRGVLTVIIELISLVGFSVATVLSGGAALPAFALMMNKL